MTDEYEYFLQPDPHGSSRPPRALWRRLGARWEYYSLLDWSWHEVPSQGPPWVPEPERLTAITAAQAAELEADHQRWVRYWARYLDPPTSPEDRPLTVVRRRSSPERELDESFTVGNRWDSTQTIIDSELPQVSDQPHLVEVDHPTAEQILREVRGVEGATQL